MATTYDKGFYESQQDGSYLSAKKILPIIYDIFKPGSVLDIGCGVGTWLNVFANDYKINDLTGVDGDYVDKAMLRIKPENFVSYDLKKAYNPGRKYDFAMSVEVAEHLPESSANNIVDSLTMASDIVMFSAALPNQIGTYHINEQYPEYWAKKFTDRGYIPVDLVRKKVWNETDVEWWYKQNIIVYVKKEVYSQYASRLDEYRNQTDPEFLTRIHPDMMEFFVQKYYQLQSYTGFMRYKLYFLKKWMQRK